MVAVNANNMILCWQNFVDPTFPTTTLAASSQASASLSVNNLIDYRPSVVWRTTGVTAEYMTVDLGSVQGVAIFIAWNHNWTVQSTIRLRGYLTLSDITPVSPIGSGTSAGSASIANGTYDVFVLDSTGTTWTTTVVSGGSLTISGTGVLLWAAFTSGALTSAQMVTYAQTAIADPSTATTNQPVFDTGIIDGWPPVVGLGDGPLGGDALYGLGGYPNLSAYAGYDAFRVIILEQTYQVQYVRLDIYDPTNSAGYLDLGRVFVGPMSQLQYNPVYGYEFDQVPLSSHVRTDSGSLRIIVRPTYRKQTFNWDFLSPEEISTLWIPMQRIINTRHDIFTILMPYGSLIEQYQTTLYGIPSENGKKTQNFYRQYQTQLVVEELI